MKKHFSTRDFFSDPALPMAVHRRTAQRPKELHSHDFSELVLVLGGNAIHFTEEGKHAIRKGDVFVIQGELAHGYRDSNNLSLINLMFVQKIDISWNVLKRKFIGVFGVEILLP